MAMKFGNSKRYNLKKRNIPNLMRTNYGVPFASPAKDGGHGGAPGHGDEDPTHAKMKKDAEGNINWEDPVEKKSSVLDPKSSTTTHTTETTQKGTSEDIGYEPKEDYEPKSACAKWLKTHPGKTCADYEIASKKWIEEQKTTKEHTKGGKTQSCSCTGADGKTVKYTATDGKTCAEAKPAACTKKPEKKKCECQSYKADGSKGPMVEYPCGGEKNPNCSKRPTTKTCMCTNPKTKKEYTYPCGTTRPDACNVKSGCDRSKHTCRKNQTFSYKECKCKKKKKYKEKNIRIKKNNCKKNKSGICYSDITIGTKYGRGGS
jgi:hypothetical protein